MKKLASLALVVLLAVLGSIGFAPGAQADPGFGITVSRHVLHSGETLTATATAKVTCVWSLEWNGDRRAKFATRTFAATWTAPTVSRPTRIPLHGQCFYDAPRTRTSRPAAGMLTVVVPPSWTHSILVTVLPGGSTVSPPTSGGGLPGVGDLPNTGGPVGWLLLAALGSLLAGAVAVRSSRPQWT